MRKKDVRASAEACERAFAYLVDEVGYRHVETELRDAGFRIYYAGPVVGVSVDWSRGDPFRVSLVRMVDGAFPPRREIRPDIEVDYVDLDILEDVVGHESEVYTGDFSPVPDDAMARAVAASLKVCGVALLGGDLRQWRALDARLKERFRADLIQHGGTDMARRYGWL